MSSKRIPPPPSVRTIARIGYACKPDQGQHEVTPWDFPTDLGITRNNRGAHGGLTAAGKADASKVRTLRERAREEGRYTR